MNFQFIWDFLGISSEDFGNVFQNILESSSNTLILFGMTLLLSLPLGLIISFGRMSKFTPLRWLTQVYLLVMRGTPLMLQLIFFFYGLPLTKVFGMTRIQVAIIAFTFNYAAYFAEIFRSGIEGIPIGQKEAADVLGFSRSQTFFRITLPQVIKRILPPMSNEFMTLVKDTSLAKVIAVVEITSMAQKMQNTLVTIVPIIIAGVFYLVMNAVVSFCFNRAEKRLSYYN